MSPCLSHCRGPAFPFKSSLKPQQGLTSNFKEEEDGTVETKKQADKLGLIDCRETFQTLDDFSETRWLTELLPLCLECQAVMSMGNQQGTKIKPHCQGYADALPKSNRFQTQSKRRRRMEGLVYADNVQRSLKKMTPRALQVPSKARRLTRLPISSSPSSGEWDLKEERQITCTLASRRKRVIGSPQERQPSWRVKLPDAVIGDFPLTKKSPLSPKKPFVVKAECSFADSDTDVSEYDNDIYSTCISTTNLEPTRKTENTARNTQKNPIIQLESEREKLECGEEKPTQWMCEGMGGEAVAQRVMDKIEELEGIIQRVTLSSTEWVKEGSEVRDETLIDRDGCVDEENCRSRAQIGSQEKGSHKDKPRVIKEFHALGEALSQSLRQVLEVEGGRAAPTEPKEISSKPNLLGSTIEPLHLSSQSYHFTSIVPRNSPPAYQSAGEETSPAPSPSLFVTRRSSSSFEAVSPILSPLFTSSQHSLPLSLTDQFEKGISDRSVALISSVGDNLFPQWAGGCRSSTTVSGDESRNSMFLLSLGPNEHDQTISCTSEPQDLLSSGNSTNQALTKSICTVCN